MDKATEVLLEALKQALAEPGEQRLYRSGKLDGLFASRSSASGEAASRAVRDGLLEVIRTEVKGKTTTEWVRLTPRGVDFLHEHESPLRALQDLRAVLQANREGMPVWLVDVQGQLQALSRQLAQEVQRWSHRLDALSQQVEQALARLEEVAAPPNGRVGVTWGTEALAYLDRRRASGAPGDCPLPELFAALRERGVELSIAAFHDGLRHLHEGKGLHLAPFTGSLSDLPEPEYALPEGTTMWYYAGR